MIRRATRACFFSSTLLFLWGNRYNHATGEAQMTKAKKMTGKVETTKLYTAEQAARILKISARRVRKLCSEGRLGRRFGGRAYMITAEELEEFKKIPREVGNPMFKKDNPRKRRR